MMRLHHSAHQVAEGTKDLISELFTSKLGFQVVFENDFTVLLRQNDLPVDIQFIGKSPGPSVPQEIKIGSQIAFLSPSPMEDLESIQLWFRERGLESQIGQYYDDSDWDLWFDVPSVFLDFVIEVIHPQFLEEINYPAHKA